MHLARSSLASQQSSVVSSGPICPSVYEKMIQDLEADVRKHIRIQQQLKLHIESMEDEMELMEDSN